MLVWAHECNTYNMYSFYRIQIYCCVRGRFIIYIYNSIPIPFRFCSVSFCSPSLMHLKYFLLQVPIGHCILAWQWLVQFVLHWAPAWHVVHEKEDDCRHTALLVQVSIHLYTKLYAFHFNGTKKHTRFNITPHTHTLLTSILTLNNSVMWNRRV